MPKSDLAEEIQDEVRQEGPVELFIGVTSAVDAAALQLHAAEILRALPPGIDISRTVVAYPRSENGNELVFENSQLPRLLPYALPAPDPTNLPWVVTSAAQRAICNHAAALEAKVCILLHGDLALLRSDTLQALALPVLERGCDLVLPVYPSGKFDGLLNHSILAPLTRSLYGKRVRYPLPQDFSCSARMLTRIAETQASTSPLLWPAVLAALSEFQVCQIHVNLSHAAQTEGLELSTVLSSLAGAAYAEMETHAAHWQRVRGSHATAISGTAEPQAGSENLIDAKPLIDSFLLGSRNLQDVWGLVLPPVTLLELKKLARLSPEAFRMPDELWVRIICDFALAYRLRTISRIHLLGALTPLYLGWVASYVQEAAKMSRPATEQRLEQLARAYEEGKPYLLSRWRWPDRFNP